MSCINKIILMALILSLIGCHNSSSIGDEILKNSKEAKSISEDWRDGEKLLIDGKKLEKKSKSLRDNGKKKISKGKSMIKDGKKQVSKASDMDALAKDKIEKGLKLQKKSEAIFKEKFQKE